jgi:glycerol-3-phosphate dehydrogenase (NAD+)
VLTGKSFDTLEREMLNGQKLQGTGTALDIHEILTSSGHIKEYSMPVWYNCHSHHTA